jgi:hypothetical protein
MSTSYEDRVKELSRIRSKRYYEKNKAIIAERRKARRLEVLEKDFCISIFGYGT